MKEVTGKGMFIAHHRGQGMQIAPATETSTAQNAADGGGTETSAFRNLISRTMLAAEVDHQRNLARRSGSGTAMRARRTVA